jgi:hypothetical protein
MANLNAFKQGVLNISSIQGNYLEVPLTFKDGAGDPIDLTQYTEIRMEIKKTYNVNEEAFLVFTVGQGLTISGDDNEILTFVLDEYFWESQTTRWVYDIVFENAQGEKFTFIKGTITNTLTASKIWAST